MSVLLYLLFLSILYCIAMKYKKRFDAKFHRKLETHTLFVLAHPDDECMFFTPTVHGMQETSNIYLLVLSNGGWDGLGKLREKEMEQVARFMGFVEHKVVDDPKIGDNPGKHG
jgi:N-acetylglucosaminylphosphatidylinositol deacetylase